MYFSTSYFYFYLQLDYSVSWQKLKDIFKVIGRVVNVDILTDREGKSKGLGEVQFEESGDAISAIGMILLNLILWMVNSSRIIHL